MAVGQAGGREGATAMSINAEGRGVGIGSGGYYLRDASTGGSRAGTSGSTGGTRGTNNSGSGKPGTGRGSNRARPVGQRSAQQQQESKGNAGCGWGGHRQPNITDAAVA